MSNESGKFNQGMDRAKDGKSSADPAIELDTPSESESAARERGYEAGKEAEATGEAVAEKSENSDSKK